MHVVMLSLHTSPLAQPGAGDAGGLNVYVQQLGVHLARSGIRVRAFTAAPGRDTELTPGFTVHHLRLPGAAAEEPWRKEAMPQLVPQLVDAMADLGSEGAQVLHSHYWSSGLAGLELASRWQVPLVHSMHTLATTKNRNLGVRQRPESQQRIDRERLIVEHADRIIANTPAESEELERCYGALSARVTVIPPGVDLQVFHPAEESLADGDHGGAPLHIVFAGRLQSLKGPHVLLEAIHRLRADRPDIRLRLSILGSPSGPEDYDLTNLRDQLGLEDTVTFSPPIPPAKLAEFFRSADAVAMPSSSESFGLVALEAQACGTPVLATRVGGLREAVQDEVTGLLVDGITPELWAEAIAELYDLGPRKRQEMGAAAARHAAGYSWTRTAESAEQVYRQILGESVISTPPAD
ncbi:glycosyltransferase [Acaricomes phytoseiuli]|uniref:glycosyltransferase n=1 Tax=Acaricomes phytoseiuli TaxID=291968 RepID=UPI002222816F|nr:glycosyltransferase [Acaricomes phytoseiuli]MCW1250119.1 glycosyltransferase [Acaricomes phytoseiuli]